MFTVQNTLAFIMRTQITIDSFKYTQLPCKTQRDSQRDLQSQIQDNLGSKKMGKKRTNKQTNKQNSGTLSRTNLTVQTTQNS